MEKTVVGAFQDHHSAETVVDELKQRGVPEKDISMVARDHGKTKEGHPGSQGGMHDLSSGIGWGGTIGG